MTASISAGVDSFSVLLFIYSRFFLSDMFYLPPTACNSFSLSLRYVDSVDVGVCVCVCVCARVFVCVLTCVCVLENNVGDPCSCLSSFMHEVLLICVRVCMSVYQRCGAKLQRMCVCVV